MSLPKKQSLKSPTFTFFYLMISKRLAFSRHPTDQQDMGMVEEKNQEAQQASRWSRAKSEEPRERIWKKKPEAKASSANKSLYPVRKFIYAGLGIFFLVVGIIGIVVPLLPTTPFLLLTAYFFSVSSETLHSWLLNHRYLGPPIKDWEINRVIRPKAKALALSMLALGIIVLWTKFGLTNLWATIPSTLCMLASGAFVATRNSRPK
jgi:uncharacterized membrane protein YbaN (DUF454 family)